MLLQLCPLRNVIHFLSQPARISESRISPPIWGWDATWMGWDGNLRIWMGVRQYIEVVKTESWDLDPVEKGPGWRWDTHLETCMVLRWCLDGTKMQFGGPGWRWDDTWMYVRCKYKDMDWGEIQLRQRKNVILGAWEEMRHKSRDLDGVEMGPRLSWDAHLETWIAWYRTSMELRYNSPVGKGPGWRWDTHLEICMGLRWCLHELRCNLVDLDGAEKLPGWRRDANIRTQIEVRFKWDKDKKLNLGAWIEMRQRSRDLDEVEMAHGLSWDAHLEMWIWRYGTRMELRYNYPVWKRPGWRWNTHLEICIVLRWCLDRIQMKFGVPGWWWDVTWMWARCKYQDPDLCEIQLWQRRNVKLRAWVEMRHKCWDLDGVEMALGLSWNAHLETWISWHGTRMVLRYNSPVGIGPGWRWGTHLENCIHLRWCLGGTKMQFGGQKWSWDVTWMWARCKYQYPGSGEMQHRQRVNVNLWAWVEMRHKCRDLDGVEMGPGLSWDAHLETWIGWYGTRMELRYNSPVGKGPECRWDTHLETCMGLRWCLDRTRMQFGGPGWSWDVTWI